MLMQTRWLRWIPVAATVLALLPIHAPALLFFPYKAEAHGITVRSEDPLPPEKLEPILAAAQARVQTSTIAKHPVQQHSIYLTRGGWRWNWLAMGSTETFAVTRMFTENTIVNRNDLARDLVYSRRAIGHQRALSVDIAHEMTHSMLRNHFGIWKTVTAPSWVIEGYADYVAGSSTLTPAEAEKLHAAFIDHPTIRNFHARLRVATILARNGTSVDRLFTDARAH
ncbi:hypothetical protein H7F51_13250 [Novosphingobium flavum]|uniref:Uncharacterized protein n=1 Tax=Novosphingobium flavum TaxID=1778672 RepID=A0A7X1FT59_9SPHN|nr:hypothetical protein [Novosphingobium flavum]MBC2666488.1 hypothetical protein [Novosphingobium flavum]